VRRNELVPSLHFLADIIQENPTEIGPMKLPYMAVWKIGYLRAQNQPEVCLNFGYFSVIDLTNEDSSSDDEEL